MPRNTQISRSFDSATTQLRANVKERIIEGIAVPYDETIDIGWNEKERFQRGAFERSIRERGDRIPFLSHHDEKTNPIGRAIQLAETPQALTASFRVSNTVAGDEALELVADGALSGLSIGFRPIQHHLDDDGTIVRTEVKLLEISLVSLPAYDTARITAVRSTNTGNVRSTGDYRRRITLIKLSTRKNLNQ